VDTLADHLQVEETVLRIELLTKTSIKHALFKAVVSVLLYNVLDLLLVTFRMDESLKELVLVEDLELRHVHGQPGALASIVEDSFEFKLTVGVESPHFQFFVVVADLLIGKLFLVGDDSLDHIFCLLSHLDGIILRQVDWV